MSEKTSKTTAAAEATADTVRDTTTTTDNIMGGDEKYSEAEMAAQEKKLDEMLGQCEKVRVKIPLINRNEPDIEVGLNGVIKIIKRGVTVDLPVPIVEILEHAGII